MSECNSGDCCCRCKSNIRLTKHPWNKVNKGSTSEFTGMVACIVQHDIDNSNVGNLFEFEHGLCELFTEIDNQSLECDCKPHKTMTYESTEGNTCCIDCFKVLKTKV